MKTILIFGQKYKEDYLEVIKNIIDALQELNLKYLIYEDFAKQLKANGLDFIDSIQTFNKETPLSSNESKALISLGGDGTILQAATIIGRSGIPIMGINLGRLGFLAYIEKSVATEAIRALAKDFYSIEERALVQLDSSTPIFGNQNFGLNDVTILKRDTSSMIIIKAFINDVYLNTYWADGIIVATPTGSTGYSLSCGGPIVFPGSGNFVITPVAPHNLNVRPIVISDESVISFEVTGRTDHFLCTLDSRVEMITADNELVIRKSDFTINMIKIHGVTFLDTMRNKLNWGMDMRN